MPKAPPLCPSCRSPLAQSFLHGRSTLLCPRGHGSLFNTSTIHSWIVDDYRADFERGMSRGKPASHLCPCCRKRFLSIFLHGIKMEHCPACTKVWLPPQVLLALPLRAEKDRDRAPGIQLPVSVKIETDVDVIRSFGSPFEGMKYTPCMPWATLGILLACLVVTQIFWDTGGHEIFVGMPRHPLRYGGLPLFLSLFTHGSWGHLLGNSYFLFVAGRVLESTMGWRKYLAFYFLTGMGAHFAHALNTDIGGIGASGAISGVLIGLVATQTHAYYVFRPASFFLGIPILGNIFSLTIRFPIWLWAFAWFAMDLFALGSGDHIGHAAHLGGGVTGAIIAYFLAEEPAPAAKKAPLPRAA